HRPVQSPAPIDDEFFHATLSVVAASLLRIPRVLLQFVFHVAAHEFFQEKQAVHLANDRARVAMAGYIGGIAGEKIANDLVHRIVPFLAQRSIHMGKNLVDILRCWGADPEYAGAFALIQDRKSTRLNSSHGSI